MSNNSLKSNSKINQKKSKTEKILEYDRAIGFLIPTKWKKPFRKKDYFAIIIGLNNRYEFERVFCEKKDFEIDEGDQRIVGIGFEPSFFKDGLILEEKYSYKEQNTFVTNTNYYEISIIDGVEIWGEKVSKNRIKELLRIKQQEIFREIKDMMKQFGEPFTLYTMKSILDQKKVLSKKVNLIFFD
jgi:hypothetical protein